MKQTIVFIILAALLVIVSPLSGQAKEGQAITVAGFINEDNAKYDYVNVMMTTSMISFLSKLFKSVTPYTQVEKAAGKNGFWEKRDLDTLTAIGMAESFGSRYCVTGSYHVQDGDRMTVLMNVYDIPSQSLVLMRTYQGASSKDLFSAIDSMIKDLLFLLIGSSVDQGTLRVQVMSGDKRYRLLVNGNYTSIVDKDSDFESLFLAGQVLRVVLVRNDDQKEVFNRTVSISKYKVTEVSYVPSGTLLLNSRNAGLNVWLNNEFAGTIGDSGNLLIGNVVAGQGTELAVKKKDAIVLRRSLILAEGETNRFDISLSDETRFEIDSGVGVTVPCILGVNFTERTGNWPGFITGGGVTAEVYFLKNIFFSGSRLGLRLYGLFSVDQYFLPSDKFASGSSILSENVRYGADLLFGSPGSFFGGMGAGMIYTFYGNYGSSPVRTDFSPDMTGNDVFISALIGYEWEWVPGRLVMPFDFRVSWNLTVPNSTVIEFGLDISLVWRFGLEMQSLITDDINKNK